MILRDYQIEIANRASITLKDKGIVALFMECRTGKTATCLQTIENCRFNNVLFLTKKKAIPSIESDYKSMGFGYNILVANYESIHKVARRYDCVVCDESHVLGSYPKPSKKTLSVQSILSSGTALILLTATPSPESYSQLFWQFRIHPRSPWQQKTFYKWAADGYVIKKELIINGFKVADYSNADKERIMSEIDGYVYTYTQEKAGFTAEVEEYVHTVSMRDFTRSVIKTIKRDKVYNGVLADTPVKEMQKVHQLGSGTIIFEDGTRKSFDPSKIDYIKRTFAGRKVAILYVFAEEGRFLMDKIKNHTTSPEEFNKSKDLVFIGQIRSTREGVNLSTAEALVMYNIEFSALSYLQGKERMGSRDRTMPNVIHWLFSDCGIEDKIYASVKRKKSFTTSIYARITSTEQAY